MKRIFATILLFIILISLVSCRTANDNMSNNVSVGDIVDTSLSENVVAQENVQSEIQQKPQNQAEENTYTSSIAKPEEILFYKNGKYGSSKDSDKNYEIAKLVESWYQSYEFDTLPFCNWEYSQETIDEIKCKETVVEICFKNSTQINMLSKIDHGKHSKIMIPLTGRYSYYVFLGDGEYTYSILLGDLGGSGLEKYFDGIALDKEVRKWESTVITPVKATFYKDGKQSVSDDKELNLKIAKHIESWFKYAESIAGTNLAATTDRINDNRRNEMAIELQFDVEIKLYGGVIPPRVRTLFIPLTGEDNHMIFQNTIDSPDYWGGPISTNGGTGLEQYFDYVQFTPLTEEEKRWRSTINTAGRIEFYENGVLVGKSGAYQKDYLFNCEISRHIESWFYHKEEIPTIEACDIPLESAWGGETYIKLWFGDGITFFGEQIVSEKSVYLIIPLTGDYAYHIFEGDYDAFSNVAYVADGEGLEQFFARLTVDNSNQ